MLAVIGVLAGVLAAMSTGRLFPTGAWYLSLDRPSWTPPGWVFPIAWTALYTMIAVAGVRLAWAGAGSALALWAGQMALNILWTPVMFGAHRIGAALVIILMLWGMIVLAMMAFWSVDKIAFALFVPYLGWISFASALNYAVYRRNPDR